MYIFAQGGVNATVYVRLRNSTSGLAQTGLVFNSAGASCTYVRPRTASAAIPLVTQSVTGAHTDGGFVEVNSTDAKGLYRLDLPDAALASGENYVLINIEFDTIIEESLIVLLNPEPNIVSANVVADGGNTAATFKTDLPNTTDDGFYQEAWILFRTGTLALAGPRKITAYTAATQFVTVTPAFTGVPSPGTEFTLVNR